MRQLTPYEFQFTHPGKGATAWRTDHKGVFSRFNSRTLGRVRLSWSHPTLYIVVVSIHAPWEGCDRLLAFRVPCCSVSIHAPWEGCDGRLLHASCLIKLFQFTHPGKGATLPLAQRYLYSLVSIHAPWEGCDIIVVLFIPSRKFQFTHPGKGATVVRSAVLRCTTVSIHAPWEGCDQLELV